jgi:hypothetical protein
VNALIGCSGITNDQSLKNPNKHENPPDYLAGFFWPINGDAQKNPAQAGFSGLFYKSWGSLTVFDGS